MSTSTYSDLSVLDVPLPHLTVSQPPSQPESRPHSRESASVTRKASPVSTSRPGSGDVRIRLPKAPQSKEVAQRLIRNSTIRPVQRFDSADYFLTLHQVTEQKRLSEASSAMPSPKDEQQPVEFEQPTPPPPLERDAVEP